MVLLATLLGWIPEWLDRQRASGAFFQLVVLAIVTGAVAALLYDGVRPQYADRNLAGVGEGRDAFRADRGRAGEVRSLLGEIVEMVGRDQTVAVVPQGPMLNYLSRRPNSTRFLNLMPPEIVSAGEERVLAAYRARPPDFVVLVGSQLTPRGMHLDGEEYGRHLLEWMLANYRPIRDTRGPKASLGLILLKYRPTAPSS